MATNRTHDKAILIGLNGISMRLEEDVLTLFQEYIANLKESSGLRSFLPIHYGLLYG